MSIKRYKSVYGENYQYDIITPDMTNKKKGMILWDDPTQDCDELVHEIHILDINDEAELYLNPEKEFGGKPRLGPKGGFTEALISRHGTVNGKQSVCYHSGKQGDMMVWQNMMPEIVPAADDAFTEPTEKKILVISAKKLKFAKMSLDAKKPEIRAIKRYGKQKHTNGSGKE